ncbi:MAG TPA: zinc-binding alcohol dehydrogenase family protein, partial [Acidimicrobiales bacterium]|nr:zinc-binding alcohol dehydrogenase family protein [Acidimicrobiales bacterium]
ERHQAVVRDYMNTPRGQNCIVIAPSNDERRDLNHRIREALIEAGKVQKASFQASIRNSRGLTQAQKKEARSYQAGDLLTFQRGSKVYGIAQGATGKVAGVDLEKRTVRVELEGGRQVEFAPARFRGAEVHQVETRRFAVGDRIGVAWLARTCGVCRFCRRGDENLCTAAEFTGWDRDGGYAESVVVDERFAYRLAPEIADDQAAPLLCAGIIGYRALRRCDLPPGGRLGIYGFGGSAHLTAQVAVHQGAVVHVLTRSAEARRLALELGAASARPADAAPPEPLDAAILFAPAGELVPGALRALDRGGILVLAGIHLSDIPPLDYQAHLFQEREVRSVTANTRRDGEEFLRLAARLGLRATTRPYRFEDAPQALADLAHDAFSGAAVLMIGVSGPGA